jgi:DNA-binding NarL/FixJ family response regulator
VARVLALSADLLFGSRVQASLVAAGHDVLLVSGEQALRDALAQAPAQAVVFDLTDEALQAARVAEAVRPQLAGARTMGFYSHVEAQAKEQARQAGIELVVPRSRMAREGAQLLNDLLAGDD